MRLNEFAREILLVVKSKGRRRCWLARHGRCRATSQARQRQAARRGRARLCWIASTQGNALTFRSGALTAGQGNTAATEQGDTTRIQGSMACFARGTDRVRLIARFALAALAALATNRNDDVLKKSRRAQCQKKRKESGGVDDGDDSHDDEKPPPSLAASKRAAPQRAPPSPATKESAAVAAPPGIRRPKRVYFQQSGWSPMRELRQLSIAAAFDEKPLPLLQPTNRFRRGH